MLQVKSFSLSYPWTKPPLKPGHEIITLQEGLLDPYLGQSLGFISCSLWLRPWKVKAQVQQKPALGSCLPFLVFDFEGFLNNLLAHEHFKDSFYMLANIFSWQEDQSRYLFYKNEQPRKSKHCVNDEETNTVWLHWTGVRESSVTAATSPRWGCTWKTQ
jgi:hypothetical protein